MRESVIQSLISEMIHRNIFTVEVAFTPTRPQAITSLAFDQEATALTAAICVANSALNRGS